jgi:hypothetical protein
VCSCQMQVICLRGVRILSEILVGKFCEMVGQCGCMYMFAQVHKTRETLVLNLHVFSLVCSICIDHVAFVFVTTALHILFVM